MRASKLIDYLYNIIDELVTDTDYLINVDFLDNDVNSYSIDKIPTMSLEEKWVTGECRRQDTFSFRSRFNYTSDQAEQLKNVGFFERFEKLIYEKNRNKILPDIDGIESIECLNCGSIAYANTTTCEMNIQIRITYLEKITDERQSL